VHFDLETACDLDLKQVGLTNYVNHESFRVLMTAWAFDDEPVQWGEGLVRFWGKRWPSTWHAFNVPFEAACLRRYGVGVALQLWRCTLAHSYARGFSGGLDKVGEQVGIAQDAQKLKEGGRLINKFCKPRRPSKSNPDPYWTEKTAPLDWARFCEYNRQDVVAERAIWYELNRWPWTPEEQRLWQLDRGINTEGVPVDLPMVRNALSVAERLSAGLAQDCLRVTGGIGPGQVQALLAWCRERGYEGEDLRAGTIEEALKGG
jgi:DNA polymerase